MYFYGKKVLFVGAHPDDIELGCGALIAHVAEQCEVMCLTLSDNQKNPVLKNLVSEHRRSMGILGVVEDHVLVEQFETRKFQQARQEILETLVQMNSRNHPDIVFTHTSSDIHQDHATATQETLRAFRGTTVLGFDCLRSSYGFFPHFLVEVSEEDVQRKLRALAEYETYKTKYYFDPEIIKATLVRHGALAEKRYAEGFDILRIVGTFERPSR